ncbi:hypothetical protein MYF79_21645 [Chitinophaga filiformis]|uniref:Uncharacterized protein n=1 Tax=Chitinophaga filiformis TaxID=104663 RepID=A0ABY4HX45_CHIFI|nr:hypothetical protein [Chitinophaga filiformis]UPK67553.1 hypothetical protein MYF79_21645 [Chitinophaga filiformis]
MQTPDIDRIAREGICSTSPLVTNPICGPSRATLVTGACLTGYCRCKSACRYAGYFLYASGER